MANGVNRGGMLLASAREGDRPAPAVERGGQVDRRLGRSGPAPVAEQVQDRSSGHRVTSRWRAPTSRSKAS